MTVTVTEPEWDEDEREKMITLAEIERYTHHSCGFPLADVLDPESDGRYVVGEVPKVCHACAAREDRVALDRELNPKRAHPNSLIWVIRDRLAKR